MMTAAIRTDSTNRGQGNPLRIVLEWSGNPLFFACFAKKVGDQDPVAAGELVEWFRLVRFPTTAG
jgi:hypothetical protein